MNSYYAFLKIVIVFNYIYKLTQNNIDYSAFKLVIVSRSRDNIFL